MRNRKWRKKAGKTAWRGGGCTQGEGALPSLQPPLQPSLGWLLTTCAREMLWIRVLSAPLRKFLENALPPPWFFFFFLFFLLAPFRTGNRRPLTYRSSVAFFFSRIIIYRSLIVPFFLSFFEKKAVSLSPFFQEYKKNWRKTRRGRRSFRTPGVFIICKWRRAFLFHPPASAKRALFFKRFPRVLIPSRAANNFQPTRNYALRRASSRILSTCIL